MSRTTLGFCILALILLTIAYDRFRSEPSAASAPIVKDPPLSAEDSQPESAIVRQADTDTRLKPAIPSAEDTPAASPPDKDSNQGLTSLPRGPDDLKDDEFLAKYKSADLAPLLEKPSRHSFPTDSSFGLFVIREARIILNTRGEEIQFRRWLGGNAQALDSRSCVSIMSSDGIPIIGSVEDGTLTVRDGPIKNSHLIGISEKHFFLIYSDFVGNQEMMIANQAKMSGILMYYSRTRNGALAYQGQSVRWSDSNHAAHWRLEGPDYCRYSFNDPNPN